MKRIKSTTVMALVLLILAACTNNTSPSSNVANPPPDSSPELNSSIITLEKIPNRVVEYYPVEVSFQFVRQDRITDEANQDGFVNQDCYLFDVLFEGEKVSGVAVGVVDASIWFLDMNANNLWLSESFMGLPRSARAEVTEMKPVVELINQGTNDSEAYLYFTNLDTIPELSNLNAGSVRWSEKERTLNISATKVTGTVTGAIDGPSVNAVIIWKDGEPELVNVEYLPSATFSYPSHVLLSGEIMSIETSRVIEMAEYFVALINEKINEIDSPRP